jgi:hypothetical protein
MASKEKLDALDLLIQVLQDHEKKLDEQITRLERILNVIPVNTPGKDLLRRYYEEYPL